MYTFIDSDFFLNRVAKQRTSSIVLISAFFILFHFFSGIASRQFASLNESTSPFWPPTGIATAILLVFGFRFAPFILLSSFLTNLTTDMPIPGVAIIALGNTIEAIICVYLIKLLHRRSKSNFHLETFSLLLSSAVACSLGATTGVFALFLNQNLDLASVKSVWITWWCGDLVGAVIFIPFVTSIVKRVSAQKNFQLKTLFELFSYIIIVFLINRTVFMNQWPESIYWSNCFVFLLAQLRLGIIASRILLAVNCLVANYFILQGYAFFEFGSENLNLLFMQVIVISFTIIALFMESLFIQRVNKIIVSIFSCGLIIIMLAVNFLVHDEKALRETELNTLADRIMSSIRRVEEHYSMLLVSSAGFVSMSSEMDRSAWKQYVEKLTLKKHYGAVNGLGIIDFVNKEDQEEYLKRVRFKNSSDFTIFTLDSAYASKFKTMFPIRVVEPYDQNRKAVGLDVGSESNRREAALKASSTNSAVATKPIQLVQDGIKRPGFLIYYPILRDNSLIGWTYAPVISDHFFSSGLQVVSDALNIKISVQENQIFSNGDFHEAHVKNSKYLTSQTFELFGLIHNLVMYPKDGFFLKSTNFPLVFGVILTLLLILLASLIESITAFNSRLLTLVDEKAKEVDFERSKNMHIAKLASLGEMAAGIAHEINNPLGVISANLSLLANVSISDEKVKNKLSTMAKSAQRIEKIVYGLKKFSRLSARDNRTNEFLYRIVSDALVILDPKIKQCYIKVEPNLDQNIKILCDSVEIEQAIVNLLNNAFDAVKNNEEKWVKINAFCEKKDAVLQVIDSGMGISADVEQKLFQPFFTTKPAGQGTGLGLSITKGIIDQHNATIQLNRAYRNTCFEVRFPIKDVG